MNQQTIKLIDRHLKKARKKHPIFVTEGNIQVPTLAAEELGEMAKEINDAWYAKTNEQCRKHKDLAIKEALDLIAILIRFIEGEI